MSIQQQMTYNITNKKTISVMLLPFNRVSLITSHLNNWFTPSSARAVTECFPLNRSESNRWYGCATMQWPIMFSSRPATTGHRLLWLSLSAPKSIYRNEYAIEWWFMREPPRSVSNWFNVGVVHTPLRQHGAL